ncbi:hypothetical protein FISHEDRAFT_74727 [Fistulina hepatica ATCC 64428]|uniref:Uncharacterized protein n=1 Tax=Fistulina hepatica ATCC 64428 TaxID=1128425 RepID=A0A0D7A9D9_9AGAR|nr:hypothetical protein FISHEDRAFT_74727 [Fistulina hepatica ATCC 64428]
MLFSSGIFATALVVFTGVARGASFYRAGETDLTSRENIGLECYNGDHDITYESGRDWIAPLAAACYRWVVENNTELWENKLCVAAASVATVNVLRNFCVCNRVYNSADAFIPSQTDLQSLDYNVYANIVGDCAWQTGGCPMTEQNFIDMVYSSITEYGGTNWPSSAQEVIGHWNDILSWAATGTDIPYLNFNDWLHYSS